jgi:cytochrome c-type biogenesis protein
MSVTAEGSNEPLILLSLYTLGLAIPFLLTSLAINIFMPLFNRAKHHFRLINIFTGLLLIFMGILMISGHFNQFSGLIQGLFS